MLNKIFEIGINKRLNDIGRNDLVKNAKFDFGFSKLLKAPKFHFGNQVNLSDMLTTTATAANKIYGTVESALADPIRNVKLWGKNEPLSLLRELKGIIRPKQGFNAVERKVDKATGLLKKKPDATIFKKPEDVITKYYKNEASQNAAELMEEMNYKINAFLDERPKMHEKFLKDPKSVKKDLEAAGLIRASESMLSHWDKYYKRLPEPLQKIYPSSISSFKYRNRDDWYKKLYKFQTNGDEAYDLIYEFNPGKYPKSGDAWHTTGQKKTIEQLPKMTNNSVELDVGNILKVNDKSREDILNDLTKAIKSKDLASHDKGVLQDLKRTFDIKLNPEGKLHTSKIFASKEITDLYQGANIMRKLKSPLEAVPDEKMNEYLSNIQRELFNISDTKKSYKRFNHILDAAYADPYSKVKYGPYTDFLKIKRYSPKEQAKLFNTVSEEKFEDSMKNAIGKKFTLYGGTALIAGLAGLTPIVRRKSSTEQERGNLIGLGKGSKKLFQEGVRK